MEQDGVVRIAYFSDVLCVWAYVSQIRLDELQRTFGDRLRIAHHFIPVFGCTAHRIGAGWQQRGAYAGFGEHVREVCGEFPHVQVHPRLWADAVPHSSAMAHLFLEAVQLLERAGAVPERARAEAGAGGVFARVAWDVRQAFFRDGRDVSSLRCLFDIAERAGLAVEAIAERIENGEAMAALCRDAELRDEHRIEGSPTYLLNDGRQKLYGNLGYKILEANVREVLERPHNQASWC